MTELLEKEITLDKSALKDFAIKARRKLKERVGDDALTVKLELV